MTLHAAKDVIERSNGRENMWAFVKHHTFSALSHCGVGNLGSRWLSSFSQRLQNLCRPDHWQMCGFADPENFLLHFCHPLVATFHGKITAAIMTPTGYRRIAAIMRLGKRSNAWRVSIFSTMPK